MTAETVTGKGLGTSTPCKCEDLRRRIRHLEKYVSVLSANVTARMTVSLDGAVDGTNRIFETADYQAAELMLFKNGILQTQGVDYTMSPDLMRITFDVGNIPQVGDVLIARVAVNLVNHFDLPNFN